MTTNELKERIEPYLLGKLDVEQALEFERAVAGDPALAREVERMRSIVEAFEYRGEAPAREALGRIGSEQELRAIIGRAERRRPDRRRIVRIGTWCAGAAAIVAMVVSVGRMPEYSSEELYNTYFTAGQHFELAPSRGGEEFPDDVRLNRAVELLEAGESGDAVALLRPLAGDDESELQDAARWNLALALLREGDRTEAAALFGLLANGESEFAARAARLETRIKQRRWF